MKRRPILLFAALLAGSVWSALASAQVDPSRTVVVVNGEEVKGAEYYRRMEYLPGVGKRIGNQLAEFPPGFITIEQIITERLIFQLAKDKGVTPTDTQIDAEIARRLSENSELLTNWKASGRTEAELRYQVKVEMSQYNVQTFGITITDQEVDTEYQTNIARYTAPRQFKLHVIVVSELSMRNAVDEDLKAGKKFTEVAAARSEDVTRVRGGEFGQVPVEAVSPNVRAALDLVKIGEMTDWIESQNSPDSKAYLKFLKDDVIPEKKLELDAKLRLGIRRNLALMRGSVRNNIHKEMADARAKAKIEIKQPEFADAYRKFIDAYLKQSGKG